MKKNGMNKTLVIVVVLAMLVIVGNILNHNGSAKEVEVEEPKMVKVYVDTERDIVMRKGDGLSDYVVETIEELNESYDNIVLINISYNEEKDEYTAIWSLDGKCTVTDFVELRH